MRGSPSPSATGFDPISVQLAPRRRSGDHPRGWELLEEVHVLSQPWATWHLRVHAAMLLAGARQRDHRPMPVRDHHAALLEGAGR